MSAPLAGADMNTRLAPASRCLPAASLLVKIPVASITTSILRSPQGSFAGSRSLRIFYRLLGAPDAIQLYIGPNIHGLARDAREACYTFFARQAGVSITAKEPPDRLEKDEALYATPDGNVLNLPGSRRS